MAIYYPGNILSTTEKTTSTTAASGMWSMPAHVQKTKSGSWPAITPAIQTDTYFNLNTLLLHGDGSNNANNTVFVDSSTNAFTVTTNGKPYQGTFSPFSQTGWSYYFNGSSDYFTVPYSAAFDYGTGDFTLEGWVYVTSTPANYGGNIFTQTTSGTNWFVFAIGTISDTSGPTKPCFNFGTSGGGTSIVSSVSLSLNTWYHVALVRSSGTATIYVNGTNVGSGSCSQNFVGVAHVPTIGRYSHTATNFFPGYISNLRLVKGTAVYTSNFTPSTTPLTAISGTSLLTCQDNRFKENSSSALTITSYSSTSVQPFSPLAPSAAYSTSTIGGSVYFASNADYFTITNNVALQLGTTYTAEAWVYCIQYGVNTRVWSDNTNGVNDVDLYVTSTGGVGVAGGAATVSGYTLPLNVWVHIAVVVNSGVLSIYINGVSQTLSGTTTGYNSNDTTTRYIGSTGGAYGWRGYISNLRFIKGTAQYTSNFTPPTAPLTAVSGTSLLLNATNAKIIDQTAKNNITTYGSAAISSTQSKFGGTSISFNGSGSYLTIPYQNMPNLLTGDFTIEFWAYFNSVTTQFILGQWQQTVGLGGFTVYLSSGVLGFDYGAYNENSTLLLGGSVSTGQWYHIAIVRNGSGFTSYLNGTSVATATSSATRAPISVNYSFGNYYTSAGVLGSGTGVADFNGYLDDVRISKVARYTSNFTPSTTAFADR